ncbi:MULTISPECIES: hypothetical protein [unclassified Saccharicrinis]|uniref:hypothetical protein n=1 Tax=unclassified Saccharicrinis TaxID=2646859 RepID=UPI003D332224
MKAANLNSILCHLMILSLFIGFITPANAQFLKKLKKKVESRVEEAVAEKVADKAEEKTNKTLDKMFEPQMPEGMTGNMPMMTGMNTVSFDEVPDSYDFDWNYALQIETARTGEKVSVDYYFKKGAEYWGARFNQGMSMFMVYDISNKLNVMFMKDGEQSLASAMRMVEIHSGEEVSESESEDGEEEEVGKFTFKPIPGKIVLGHKCQGYLMENDEYKLTIFSAHDTEVSFGKIYSETERFPNWFQTAWLNREEANGLMMEMIMLDKKDENNNMQMKCVKLEKHNLVINKSDYQSF